MDRRWIYILIILIIGISALYCIASSSNNIGRAIVDVDKFVITIPDSFNIDETDKSTAALINRATNEKIGVTDWGKGNFINKIYQDEVTSAQNDEQIVKYENVTGFYHDIKIKTIYKTTSNNKISSDTYFMKFNHTIEIEARDFHDKDSIEKNVHFIMDTLNKDYKQKQD